MESSLISVIIPIYNVQQYLSQCVESILAQTYQNLEIILVDDGSTDDSGRLCDALTQRDNRIKAVAELDWKTRKPGITQMPKKSKRFIG